MVCCARSLLVLVCAAFTACATGSPGFPSSEQLEALSRTPSDAKILAGPVVEPDEWTLTGPLPERLGAIAAQPQTPWEEALLRSAGGSLTLTEGLRCFAQEYARFYLERQARPGEVLVAYMGGACALSGPGAAPAIVFGEVSDQHSDEMLLALWRGNVKRMLKPVAANPLGGIAFARGEGRAVLAVVQIERPAVIEVFTPAPNERDRIVIRGRLLRPVERVFAVVNRGRFGYDDCVFDPEVVLPDFAVACQLAADDASAWLQIGYVQPGRVLGYSVLGVLVRRDQTQLLAYRRRSGSDGETARDTRAFREAALDAVNGVREDAGLGELELQEVQSDMAESLAPRYFAVLAGQAPAEEGDVVALGLMAGWDVDGTIRDANITSALVAETFDVGRWLDNVVEQPFGRSAVLDPGASAIAIGPIIDENFADSGRPVIGAVITTYALFDDSELAVLQEQIYERLAAEREALGHAAPRKLDALDDDARGAAARLRGGKVTPISALSSLVRIGVGVLQRPLQGFVVETSDLNQLEFPEHLLGRRVPEVSITLTRYRPEGEPWGRYVVLLVSAGPRPMA